MVKTVWHLYRFFASQYRAANTETLYPSKNQSMSVGSVTSVFYTFPFPSFKRMYLKRQRVVFHNQANGHDKQKQLYGSLRAMDCLLL